MFRTFKKIPQQLTLNSRKIGLQLILLICWVIIIAGTFTFLS